MSEDTLLAVDSSIGCAQEMKELGSRWGTASSDAGLLVLRGVE